MASILGGKGGSSKRPGGKGGKQDSSVASKIIRDTIRQGGRINEETFKKIVQAKLKEARTNSMNKLMDAKMAQNGGRSANAQKSIEMMNEMYAAQDSKKEAKEVIIVARRFHNGKIDEKGRIFDIAGNMVAKVNVKNGVMISINGEFIGKYASKGGKTYGAITDAIEKSSPYLINQRQVLLKQKQDEDEERVKGSSDSGGSGWGSKISLDIWSKTPTNAWGNVETDVWGRPAANVWGKTASDSWGNSQVDAWGNQI